MNIQTREGLLIKKEWVKLNTHWRTNYSTKDIKFLDGKCHENSFSERSYSEFRQMFYFVFFFAKCGKFGIVNCRRICKKNPRPRINTHSCTTDTTKNPSLIIVTRGSAENRTHLCKLSLSSDEHRDEYGSGNSADGY